MKTKKLYDAKFHGICLSAAYLNRLPSMVSAVGEHIYDDVPVMMDSGAFQAAGGKFGNSENDATWQNIIDLAENIDPKFIVIDDEVGDYLATFNKAAKRIRTTDRRLLAPLQELENKRLIEKLLGRYEDKGYDFIGVPYHQLPTKNEYHLKRMLQILDEYSFDVHILGCPVNPDYLELLDRYDVASIDSSSHVRALRNNHSDHPMARPKAVHRFLEKQHYLKGKVTV